MTIKNKRLAFFATAPKGLELLLVDELKILGAAEANEKLAGVTFSGDLEVGYKACLWSRFANRILLFLSSQHAETPEELYSATQAIHWDEHLTTESTLAVHCVCQQSEINHSLFAAQKVKDAIVDQLRNKYGTRPNVDRVQPDVSIYVYIYRNEVAIYLDLSGESLHRRGYRLAGGEAPLKENLAAAVLQRANWPEIANAGGTLMDPMCGSGTLLIEGALMAGDIAPGLLRNYFGFLGWKQHDANLWQRLKEEAELRRAQGLQHIPTLVGYDQNPDAIHIAFDNIERAGLRGKIHVEKRDLMQFAPKPQTKHGLVVTNPPYGERLGELELLQPLYTLLGERLKEHFEGWQAAVLTGNPDLGKQMGLRANHYYALFNGAIPCKLLLFSVTRDYFFDRSPQAENERRIKAAQRVAQLDDNIQMFVNRLAKNFKHYSKRASKQGLARYTVYDADLPEYAFLIELTLTEAYVIEYQAPKSIDKQKALQRQQQVLAVLPEALGVSPRDIYFSVQSRKK